MDHKPYVEKFWQGKKVGEFGESRDIRQNFLHQYLQIR